MRLTWQSKMVSGSTVWPDVALSQSANRHFAFSLGLADLVAEAVVVGERHELAELGEVGHPLLADRLGDRASERRVRQP